MLNMNEPGVDTEELLEAEIGSLKNPIPTTLAGCLALTVRGWLYEIVSGEPTAPKWDCGGNVCKWSLHSTTGQHRNPSLRQCE
jgi:hypothetical protein